MKLITEPFNHARETNSIPDNALVHIHGFVMLRGLDEGRVYLVKRDEEKSIYWFCVPRTGRKICGHYMGGVNHGLSCFPRGDHNAIEIFAKKVN